MLLTGIESSILSSGNVSHSGHIAGALIGIWRNIVAVRHDAAVVDVSAYLTKIINTPLPNGAETDSRRSRRSMTVERKGNFATPLQVDINWAAHNTDLRVIIKSSLL